MVLIIPNRHARFGGKIYSMCCVTLSPSPLDGLLLLPLEYMEYLGVCACACASSYCGRIFSPFMLNILESASYNMDDGEKRAIKEKKNWRSGRWTNKKKLNVNLSFDSLRCIQNTWIICFNGLSILYRSGQKCQTQSQFLLLNKVE